MNQIRKRLTYANVMSTIAVFLVLGGATALAAGLAKNSVGSKQLKKNAVTAAKIKKNAVTTSKIKKDAVTGTQVKESTLGTVPSAAIASALTPPEAVHIVGNPGEPGFENGGSNAALEGLSVHLNPVGFWKDHDGVVHLQGIARVGKNGNGIVPIFTLPAGFRPAAGTIIIQAPAGENAAAIIGGTNTVLASGGGSVDLSGRVAGTEEELSALDGITFRAES
ncbi:MAG TPA: hypothetical protein VFX44_00885 [Solirubrobacterales bacterium]|nr:hypothetical protein [Solirubrobacterales bacterium]